MKKIVLALLAAVAVTTANAQPKSWLLYGDLSFSTSKDDAGNKHTMWGINPGIGYQFNKNWTGGLVLSYGMEKMEPETGAATVDNSSWSAGLFGRYTHSMGNMFFGFGQAEVIYGSTKMDAEVGSPTNSGVMVKLWPAVGMNIGKGYAMTFSMGGVTFSSMKSSAAGAESVTDFNLNFGHVGVIGLQKTFTCMHKKHKDGDSNMNDGGAADNDDAPKKSKKAKKSKKEKEEDF